MKNILFIFLFFPIILLGQNQTVGLFQYDVGSYDGYTLFSPDKNTYLIDNCGKLVHSWQSAYSPGLSVYLLEDGNLLRTCRISNSIFSGGGSGGRVEKKDWNNNLLWSYNFSSSTYYQHHDIEPMPNGNILVLCWEYKTLIDAILAGRDPSSLADNELWPSYILEVQPQGNNGINVVWEWHLWDHLVQNRDPQYDATFGEIDDYPELMNINEGNVGSSGPGNANADWMHINAIDYNEMLDQIVISSRFMGEIFIIDHSTTTEEAATHSGGNSGKGGDFLYRWGNPQNYDRGINTDQQLTDQHSVNWIDEGYPGEGNLILFNNRQVTNQSAGVEFVLPLMEDGNYFIAEDEPFGPSEPIWIYHPGNGFHSSVQSGAFRLPNGNTLLTVADDSEFIEVSYDGSVLWEYDYPLGNNGMIARGQKYAIDYFDQEIFLGDLNEDTTLNVLDVIILVNIVLGNSDFNFAGDMNTDGIANILDVVILVSIILN